MTAAEIQAAGIALGLWALAGAGILAAWPLWRFVRPPRR